MELILTILAIITLITALVVFTEDGMSKTFFYSLLALLPLILVMWIGLTDSKEVEIQIHEATSSDKSFSYYVDYENKIIPVPNNTVKVIKNQPRKWSINLETYEIIVE